MLKEHDQDRYPQQPPPLPQYDISPELKKLVLMFIGTVFINFFVAGICALVMRIIQTNVPIPHIVDSISQNVLYYALLTSHGVVYLLCYKQMGAKASDWYEMGKSFVLDYGTSCDTRILFSYIGFWNN